MTSFSIVWKPAGKPGIRVRTPAQFLILAIVCLSLIACTDNLATNRPYILTTATTGGTYYPVGVALATISKSKLYETDSISLSAISSAGSMENIKLLRDNQAQFALLQGIFAAWAWNGDGPFRNEQPFLRSIAAMWSNTEHFVLRKDLAPNATMMDFARLDGQRFAIGARNSGAERSGDYIFNALDIDYRNRLQLAYMGYGATANAIQDGTIVGMNVPAGPPVSAISRAFAAVGEDIYLLSFTADDLAAVNRKYPLWRMQTLAANTYPNQDTAVQTIAHPNVFAVRADIPDQDVYLITKAMWENLGVLSEIHKATREMRLDIALVGLGAPLHPGAARYYQEQGIEIPAELNPP